MNGQMNRDSRIKTRLPETLAIAVALLLSAGLAFSQVPVDDNGNPLPVYSTSQADDGVGGGAVAAETTALTAQELEELVGPVALYPDDLLAIVLPASTYPLEIVQAARFLEQLENDSTLKPDEEWDESVVALLNYPDVVRMMDEDIDWTWRLGEAVLGQQTEIIAAVEAFRDRAYAAGNLKTDERQKVSYDEGIIEIVPVNEEIIYVPYYEPAEVIVRQARPVYYYYPDPYPVYYYPYPVNYGFRSGYFWGVTTAFSIGWSNHYLHVYHPSYWGHPYYGRSYYSPYYRSPSITVYNNWYVNNRYENSRYRYRDGDYWRPRSRAGSRQDEPRVTNYHYAPNGSNNSRNFTVSERNRLRATNNGRMDLNLRDRDGRQRTAADSERRAAVTNAQRNATTGSVSANRSGGSTATNRANRGVANSSRSAAHTAGSAAQRTREPRAAADIRFRDRSADTTPSANSRSNAAISGNRNDSGNTNRTTAATAIRRTVAPAPAAAEQRVSMARQPARSAPARSTSTRQATPVVSARQPSGRPVATTTPRTSRVTPTQRTAPPRAAATPAAQSAPRETAPAAAAPRTNTRSATPAARSNANANTTSRRTASKPRARNGN
jgi:hypothetical protein